MPNYPPIKHPLISGSYQNTSCGQAVSCPPAPQRSASGFHAGPAVSLTASTSSQPDLFAARLCNGCIFPFSFFLFFPLAFLFLSMLPSLRNPVDTLERKESLLREGVGRRAWGLCHQSKLNPQSGPSVRGRVCLSGSRESSTS